MICPNCRRRNAENAKVCLYCGAVMKRLRKPAPPMYGPPVVTAPHAVVYGPPSEIDMHPTVYGVPVNLFNERHTPRPSLTPLLQRKGWRTILWLFIILTIILFIIYIIYTLHE